MIQTLTAIISNILKYPEEKKFRVLNLTNQRVQKRVLISDAALVILTMLGFEMNGMNLVCANYLKENFEFFLDLATTTLKKIELEGEKPKELVEEKKETPKETTPKEESPQNLAHHDNLETKKDVEEKTETIKLKKPKLKKYKLQKENQVFEVYEQYEIKKVLGFGAYGIVVLAYDNVRKRNVAIKKNYDIFKYDGEYQKRIFREVQIMLHFINHPNVSRVYLLP